MATVILVRHGRTTANATGVLAGRLPGVRLDETGHRAGGRDRRAARAGAPGGRGVQPPRALPADDAARSPPRRPATLRRHHRASGSASATTASGRAARSRTWPRSRCGRSCSRSPRPPTFPRRGVDAGDAGPRGRGRPPPRRARRGRARRRRGVAGGEPRRRDQVDPGRRPRHPPRPLPAHPRRPGVGLDRALHRVAALRARHQHARRRPVVAQPAAEEGEPAASYARTRRSAEEPDRDTSPAGS